MAFTYNISDVNDKIALVRMLLPDTDQEDATFQDEEIQRALTENNNDVDLTVDQLNLIRVRILSEESVNTRVGSAEITENLDQRRRALITKKDSQGAYGASRINRRTDLI